MQHELTISCNLILPSQSLLPKQTVQMTDGNIALWSSNPGQETGQSWPCKECWGLSMDFHTAKTNDKICILFVFLILKELCNWKKTRSNESRKKNEQKDKSAWISIDFGMRETWHESVQIRKVKWCVLESSTVCWCFWFKAAHSAQQFTFSLLGITGKSPNCAELQTCVTWNVNSAL